MIFHTFIDAFQQFLNRNGEEKYLVHVPEFNGIDI
jgi:hypothetical protein